MSHRRPPYYPCSLLEGICTVSYQWVKSRHECVWSVGTYWQRVPLYLGGQTQVKSLTPSTQVPPFLHFNPLQSSMFSEHVGPAYPGWHKQSNPLNLSFALAMKTGSWDALVCFFIAGDPFPARWAPAAKYIEEIHTRTTTSAGMRAAHWSTKAA